MAAWVSEAYLLSPVEVDRARPGARDGATIPAGGRSRGPSSGVGHSPEDRTLTMGGIARHNLTHPIELEASGPGDYGSTVAAGALYAQAMAALDVGIRARIRRRRGFERRLIHTAFPGATNSE